MSDCSRNAFKTPKKHELKPCPFCGKTETLAIADCIELEECEQFEHCNKNTFKMVACCYNEGGCGASSAYRPTELEAIEAWNTRHVPTCTLNEEEIAYKDGQRYTTILSCSHCSRQVIPGAMYCQHCGYKVVD